MMAGTDSWLTPDEETFAIRAQPIPPSIGGTLGPIHWEQLGNKILLFLPRFTLPTNLRATESSGVMVGAVGIEHDPLF